MRKFFLFILFITVLIVLTVLFFLQDETTYQKNFVGTSTETEITLEEKVGQLFVIGHWDNTPTHKTSQLIKDLHLGGVIIMSVEGSEQKVNGWTTAWQEATHPTPLLIGIDQEGGIVSRLKSENFLQIAQPDISTPEQAYEVAGDRAQSLAQLGINLSYSPVVDTSVDSESFMYDRVFREPSMIASLGDAMVRGYQNNNVIAVPKHFPGHPDSSDDSHLSLPILDISSAEYRSHTKPFEDLLMAGNTNILMTAHILVPSIDPDYPATVSKAVIDDLRDRLQYDGVVITDDLVMQAISDNWQYEESAVLALQAGADMLMLAAEPEFASSTIESVLDAVANEELSEERINEAYERVKMLKKQING